MAQVFGTNRHEMVQEMAFGVTPSNVFGTGLLPN